VSSRFRVLVSSFVFVALFRLKPEATEVPVASGCSVFQWLSTAYSGGFRLQPEEKREHEPEARAGNVNDD